MFQKMSHVLISQLRATSLRSTSATQRALYDQRLSQLEGELLLLKEQASALAAVAFNADFALVANDGTRVPALKQVLCEKSRFFKRMMEHGESAEARAAEVVAKTGDGIGASTAALRHLMALLYGQQLQTSTKSAVLLEVCELATLWEIDSILESMSTVLVASAKASAETACEMLVAARRHTEADSQSEVWKRLRKAAAQGVGEAGRKLMEVSAFKDLDLPAICEAMTYVKTQTISLPSFEVDTSSEDWKAGRSIEGPPAQEDLSWLLGAAGATLKACMPRSRHKACMPQSAQGTSTSVNDRLLLAAVNDGLAVVAKCSFWIRHPDHQHILTTVSTAHRHVSVFGLHSAVAISPTPYLSDGKFVCGGHVEVPTSQRQFELFNLWLLASKRVASPLSPVDSLLCLRGCATGCDVDGASVGELQAMLDQRGLSTSGAKGSLQLRLRDAVYAEVPKESAAAKATKVFAKMVARHYHRSAGNLKDLDAASVSTPRRSFAALSARIDASAAGMHAPCDCPRCACVPAARGRAQLRRASGRPRGGGRGQHHRLGATRGAHRRRHRKGHAARALAARPALAARRQGSAQGAHEALPCAQGAGDGGDWASDEARRSRLLHAKAPSAHGRQRGHTGAEAQEAEALPPWQGGAPQCLGPHGRLAVRRSLRARCKLQLLLQTAIAPSCLTTRSCGRRVQVMPRLA